MTKGSEVNIPQFKSRYYGNVNHLRDVSVDPWKSFLFFLTEYWPWNLGCLERRLLTLWKSNLISSCQEYQQ